MAISYNCKAIRPVVTNFDVKPPGAEGQKMFKHFWSHDQDGCHVHVCCLLQLSDGLES